MLIIISIAFIIASYVVSSTLKRKVKKYSQIPLPYSGAEIAQRMLRENGINNVSVRPTSGSLSDFYNPSDHSVNLSEDVYSACNVAAAAVAAHECGHAVQHACGYKALNLRTALVPLQNISAKVLNFIFIANLVAAFLLPNIFPWTLALQIIIAAYAIMSLFSVVTLGVEIDASKRAINWLTSSGVIAAGETRDGAVDALKWAAYTYLVVALSSIVTLIYYVLQLTGRDE